MMMKPFVYQQPKDIKQASALAGQGWQKAILFAGGTDVLGLLKDGVETPEALVNLKSVEGLQGIEFSKEKGLTIGALVTVAEIAEHPDIKRYFPALAQAAAETASPQLRNMGTVGGNLCQRPRCWYFRGDFDCLRKGGDECFAVDGENKYHCVIGGGPCFIVHPSDLAVALLALDAKLTIVSQKGSKTVPIAKFFVLPEEDPYRENILFPGEIVTKIHVPFAGEEQVSGYLKFKERDVWDFAVVSVAASLRIKNSKIVEGKIAFGGVAPKPWEEKELNERLRGLEVSEQNIKMLKSLALKDAEPMQQNAYKVPLARNLLGRLLLQLSG
ncbi:FAD binding domain-containing protein [Calditrichota bacterium GD2]